MPQSQPTQAIYDAVEEVLKAVLPQTCKLFHASAPLQMLDSVQRQAAQLCVWSIAADRPRVNSSGLTPVHDLTVEISLVGALEPVDAIAVTITETFTGEELGTQDWTLDIDVRSRRDFWEAQIQTKRIWLQLAGIAIRNEAAG